ncbi:MAG: hypothetical protein JNK49_18130 [Planctomycetes bacterium]|nr:hypothetical protein [Planctomycetota bacterium]
MTRSVRQASARPGWKHLLTTLCAVGLVYFGGRALYFALASDTTKIGRLLADEAAAFQGANILHLLPGFATDYRDDTTGADVRSLRAAVLWLWQNRRNAQGEFGWRVALPEGAGLVEVDGDAATAKFPLQLFDRVEADAEPRCELQVEARLARRSGDWWLVGSQHVTTAGRLPRSEGR